MDLKEALTQAGLVASPTSTNPDYILTPRDEELALNNAKRERMEHLIWRMKDRKCLPDQIEKRIRETDWDAQIDPTMVLDRANKFKAFQMWMDERRAQKEQEAAERANKLVEHCDYHYFYWLMKNTCRDTGRELIETPETLQLIKTICYFMSRDPMFESELEYDLNKGLLIRGACGLGKTFLFQCVKNNPLHPVKMISMLEVTESVKEMGGFELLLHPRSICYLDDVGTEAEKVMHYGTPVHWFKDFFERFYLKGENFNNLVISTNLSFDELEQKYGYRFRSRAKEVFNVIDVEGKDLRS